VNFCEGAILQFVGAQVMQYKNGDCGGESAIGKGQRSRIALHNSRTGTVSLRKTKGRHMIIFEAGYARNAFSQFGGGGARPSPYFQEVLAQL